MPLRRSGVRIDQLARFSGLLPHRLHGTVTDHRRHTGLFASKCDHCRVRQQTSPCYARSNGDPARTADRHAPGESWMKCQNHHRTKLDRAGIATGYITFRLQTAASRIPRRLPPAPQTGQVCSAPPSRHQMSCCPVSRAGFRWGSPDPLFITDFRLRFRHFTWNRHPPHLSERAAEDGHALTKLRTARTRYGRLPLKHPGHYWRTSQAKCRRSRHSSQGGETAGNSMFCLHPPPAAQRNQLGLRTVVTWRRRLNWFKSGCSGGLPGSRSILIDTGRLRLGRRLRRRKPPGLAERSGSSVRCLALAGVLKTLRME